MWTVRRLLPFTCAWVALVAGSISFDAHGVGAQQLAPAAISGVEVMTVDGKTVGDAPLMAGATYRVNFTIEVAAGLKEVAVLKTSLVRASGSDRFWTLRGDYAGIDPAAWQPGQSTLSFNAVPGKVQLTLEGSVPETYALETLSTGQQLHLSKEIAMLELSLGSGSVVSDLKLEVIDSAIEKYRSALAAKKQVLSTMNADPAYARLAEALVASAEAQASIGYLEQALKTLDTVPNSGWVGPRSSTSYVWIIAGALAVLAVLFGFLLMRARSETGFIKRQTDGQAKRLQILALKAKRIGDSALTEGIEQVSKELQQSAGGG